MTQASRMTELCQRGAIFLVLLVVGAIYWKVQGYPFLLWDDDIYVTSRPVLQQIGHGNLSLLPAFLSPEQAWSGKFWEYFPLRDLSYGIDAWLGGGSPSTFHRTNLILHLISTLLVWVLARRFGLKAFYAAIAAACFGLHPLAVEPVSWVSGRKDLLYTSLTLLSLISFSFAIQKTTKRPLFGWAGAFLFALLAFISKGAGIVAFALLIWTTLWSVPSQRKRHWLALLPLGVTGAVWVVFTLQIGKKNMIIRAAEGTGDLSLWQRLFLAIGEPCWALLRMLLPFDLSPSYIHASKASNWWMDPYSWMMILALLLGWVFWRKGKTLPTFLFWSLGGMALAVMPSSGIVPVNQYRADRFVYLALAFGGVTIGWSLQHLKQKKLWASTGLGLLMLFWVVQTYDYSDAWKNDIALWAYVHQQDAWHPNANLNLGYFALTRGKFKVAEKLLLRVVKIRPKDPKAWGNLGFVWLHSQSKYKDKLSLTKQKALLKQAHRAFVTSIRLHPTRSSLPYLGLGKVARVRGQKAKAEAHLRKGLSLKRAEVGVLLELADLLWTSQRKKEAMSLIQGEKKRFGRSSRLKQWLKTHQ